MKRIFALGVLLISGMSLAQVQNPDFDKEVSDSEIDSANWSQHTIVLQDVNAYSLKFNKDIEKKYYIWLERRVDDIYPFLQKAVTEYYLVKDSADQISSKRERRRYIKKRYNELADQYEEKLKQLSTSRGQILCKLINKETGKTTYDIIKELRGGFSAFLWNTAGGAFNIDLKKEFDPEKTREDLYLAVILQRGIASGKYQPIDKNPSRKKENLRPIFEALKKK
ncbi:DUF4294 domain-containing protein [Ornithobacterium rhinotracheale]|uniref:DUF4294 domain-containing protein n=1 Tax=Ornithobacterium rhinotracheale (strain ATCC 51463 / DSM 15997 / CCUG 23171 / CIP 104009 / LMG 9086) TaxID=867902 RepID=I4A392_ORNRL|nr:DUF4294 domain-containing protein [Ornithobacterium rhinotracheale]AFL98426.1 hypothetical protein Ornrh_2295 [Ornithobacterium rhinotracheale DSM 15997]AIQ00157.1 molecular chaperone DnaJ [Ornithobacterium rhinotracheale ORT-UMN 88]KGB65863.1 hypothetical protein Q787_11145 [Ornithobacterium rhinotracheale H06-030791]MBN3662854.1 DUF4294 domain-containing protein [Ornithobacterium rhinotracheale]MCK0193227.1 DUF4294 domain-containing protein [Ornithobacterium rhinotracheale]